MASINTEKLLEGLKAYFNTGQIADAVTQLKADFSITGSLELIREAVKRVEILADDMLIAGEGVTGDEKLAAVKKWADDCIDLPTLLEWLDNLGIDAVCNAYVAWRNLKDGKRWVEKIKGVL